jgi:putative ABC transport system ATP-binding protein
VLADEPTGNLDSAATADLIVLLQALNRQGVTLVVVTHDP